YAGDSLQALFKNIIGNVRQVQQAPLVTLHIKEHNRLGVRIPFGNYGRLRIGREISLGPGHTVPHIIGGGFHVRTHIKLHGNAAVSVITDRGEGFNAGDSVDGFLQWLSNLGFNHIRVGPYIGRPDVNDRWVHTWIFPDAQKTYPNDPKQDDGNRKHNGQYWPVDTD